jgi:hypothetical protein
LHRRGCGSKPFFSGPYIDRLSVQSTDMTDVIVTVGELLKQKFGNFVLFCESELDAPEDLMVELRRANKLPSVALIAVLAEMTSANREAIESKDVEKLGGALNWERLRDLQKSTSHEQQEKIWAYLSCFLELST